MMLGMFVDFQLQNMRSFADIINEMKPQHQALIQEENKQKCEMLRDEMELPDLKIPEIFTFKEKETNYADIDGKKYWFQRMIISLGLDPLGDYSEDFVLHYLDDADVIDFEIYLEDGEPNQTKHTKISKYVQKIKDIFAKVWNYLSDILAFTLACFCMYRA